MHILAMVDEVSFERFLLHLNLHRVVPRSLGFSLFLLLALLLVVELLENQVTHVLGLLPLELLLAFDPVYPVDLYI